MKIGSWSHSVDIRDKHSLHCFCHARLPRHLLEQSCAGFSESLMATACFITTQVGTCTQGDGIDILNDRVIQQVMLTCRVMSLRSFLWRCEVVAQFNTPFEFQLSTLCKRSCNVRVIGFAAWVVVKTPQCCTLASTSHSIRDCHSIPLQQFSRVCLESSSIGLIPLSLFI